MLASSHPVCTFFWQKHFKKDFFELGQIIKHNNIRISMHPDQFIVLNSNKKEVVKRSIKELMYHAEVLDLMNLDKTSKIQLHLGGAYGDKEKSIQRFIDNYKKLDTKIKKRLVIENDDRIYSLKDCLFLSSKTKIPILFDVFHHKILNNNERTVDGIKEISKTWDSKDGIPMIDYSSQEKDMKKGKHAETIDLNDFKNFLSKTKQYDFDIILEIKDKEKSALRAIKMAKNDPRFIKV